MDQLVPIGRFSKMTRLSIKALRIYDERGLLPPTEVDAATGYRYYTLGQANRAEAIRVLRSLGMSLDSIGEVLRAEEPEVVAKLLDEHRLAIEADMREQQRRLTLIEELLQKEDPLVPYDVTTKLVEAQDIVSARRHAELATVEDTIADGFGAIVTALERDGVAPAGSPFIVFHEVIDEDTGGQIEMCIPVNGALSASDDVSLAKLDGGLVVTTVHRGPYREIAPAYHVLTGWIQRHGHEIDGPPREIYLNDPTTVAPGDELTELQWPIR